MYDAKIARWLVQDPLAEKYYPFSAYNYCVNNPVIYVDPDGKATNVWWINQDGKMILELNNNNYDDFYIQKSDSEYIHVATLSKNKTKDGVELVEFPKKGNGFSRYGEEDNGGDHYVQPSTAAALFGAINMITEADNSIIVQFGDMSAADGGQPGTAHAKGTTSHVNGTNVDVRYIRSDRKVASVTVDDNAFDKTANQLMVDSFSTFGFRDQLSYKNSSGWLLKNTRHYKNHHHHLHIQRFNPKIYTK
jgi:hypothetical protein